MQHVCAWCVCMYMCLSVCVYIYMYVWAYMHMCVYVIYIYIICTHGIMVKVFANGPGDLGYIKSLQLFYTIVCDKIPYIYWQKYVTSEYNYFTFDLIKYYFKSKMTIKTKKSMNI